MVTKRHCGYSRHPWISFAPLTARFLRISLTVDAAKRWWSVVELDVCNTK